MDKKSDRIYIEAMINGGEGERGGRQRANVSNIRKK
jgi:hypothetical protein